MKFSRGFQDVFTSTKKSTKCAYIFVNVLRIERSKTSITPTPVVDNITIVFFSILSDGQEIVSSVVRDGIASGSEHQL